MRVRIRFSKRGPARYLSHSDTVRAWERSFRRARLPLAYSRGFSPGPQLRFGPPLPVGYEGLAEVMDADLDQPVPLESLKSRLADALPPGLGLIDAEFTPVSKTSLMSAARAADYKTSIMNPPSDIAGRIARFLNHDSVALQITRGKKVREIDARRAVMHLEQSTENILNMRLMLGHGAACRPEDIARALGLEVEQTQRLSVVYEFPARSK